MMGSKNDDVVEKVEVTKTKAVVTELTPVVRIWVDQVNPLVGLKVTVPVEEGQSDSGSKKDVPTSSPVKDEPKGPTSAALLLKEVNQPRPTDLTAPEGANGEEINQINTLHAQLVVHLQEHDGGENLTVAQGMMATLKEAVANVPLRIAREIGEARETHRLALSTLTIPEGLPETERLPLEQRATLLKDATEKGTSLSALNMVADGIVDLGEKLRKAGEAVTLRSQKAEALRLRIAKAVPSDQALTTETTPLKERGQSLLQRLTPPLTDGGLEGVATDTGALEVDVKNLAETVVKRGETAETLRQRLLKITAAPGLPPDEANAFGTQVTQAGLDLKAPYSPEMLDKVGIRAGELEKAAQEQIVDVSNRAKRAETLAQRLDKITAPPRVTPEEAKELTEGVEKARLQLKPPHVVLTLDSVDKTAGELELRAKTLAETVVKRDDRAKAVTEKMKLLLDPKDANNTEKNALKLAREAATGALVDPPTETALVLAEQKVLVAETLLKDTSTAIGERVIKRKELTDALDKLDIPATALPADFRTRSKAQTALRKQIADANATDTLQKAEEGVKAETKLVGEMAALLVERGEAEKDIATARETLAAKAQTAEQGFLSALQKLIVAAAKQLPLLTDKAEITKLRKGLSDHLLKLGDSEAYAKELAAFLVSASLQAQAPGAVDPAKIKLEADKARLAAQAKSVTMDYAGARQELAAFEKSAGLTKGSMAQSDVWQQTLMLFDKTYGEKVTQIGKCKAPDPSPTLASKVAAARKIPAPNTDPGPAGVTLNSYGPAIVAFAALAELWGLYASVRTTESPAVNAVDKAFEAAEKSLPARDYAKAAAAFNGLSGKADEKAALARQRLAKLQGSVGNLDPTQATLRDEMKKQLKPLLEDIKKGKVTQADVVMNTVETMVKSLIKWIEPANRVKGLHALHDAKDTLKLTTEADTKATAKKFGEALPLLVKAEENLRALAIYNVQIERARKLRDAQVDKSPPHTLCVQAITKAEKELTEKDGPPKTLVTLKALFENKDLKVMAANIDLWLKRHKAMDAATRGVVKKIPDKDPREALEKSLAAAVTMAATKDYATALDLLDAHEPLLKQALEFAHARGMAMGVLAGLKRAAKAFSKDSAKIYGKGGEGALNKRIGDCNDLAKKTDFVAATKEYKKFLGECEALAAEAAKLYEDDDGKDTNAGHSLDRHGPGVSEEDLLRRLQTGIAPDNKKSETRASSKFESSAAWLAGREQAESKAQDPLEVEKVDLTKKSYALGAPNTDKDMVLEKSVEIDHGGPIDGAFEGIKPNTEVLPDGTLEEAGTFETFRELKGITKSTTKFVFVIDSPDDDKDDRPRNVGAYRSRYKAEMEKQNKAAFEAYEKKKPKPKNPPADKALVPTTIPGRWVMMQHFPLVKGWDQEKGDYIE
ncbi:MAG: hypothetical protein ACT4OK_03345 [Gemmobacter sp.]